MSEQKFNMKAMRQRVSEEIEKQGRSQKDIEAGGNLGKGFLHNLLKRDQVPSVSKVDALANELGVSVAYLMYGTDVPPDLLEILEMKKGDPQKFYQILAILNSDPSRA